MNKGIAFRISFLSQEFDVHDLPNGASGSEVNGL